MVMIVRVFAWCNWRALKEIGPFKPWHALIAFLLLWLVIQGWYYVRDKISKKD
jgi:hypothetical protein